MTYSFITIDLFFVFYELKVWNVNYNNGNLKVYHSNDRLYHSVQSMKLNSFQLK